MKKIILLFILILLPSFALGLSQYKFEFGIPFIVKPQESLPLMGFIALLQTFIKISIPLAGFIGFLIIIYAGFEYALSGGNQNKQKDAQNRIKNVIIGLVLLFLIWVIFYIINPDILKIQNLSWLTYTNNPNNNNNYNGEIPPALNITLTRVNLTRPSQIGNSYLAEQLASKINTLQTTISWQISDACIKGFNSNKDFPCMTTCLPSDPDCATRSINDAHYYGLAVDLVTTKDPNNEKLIPLAKEICKQGLDVLIESDHLHVVLSSKDYTNLGITNSLRGISPGSNEKWSMGQWYTQGNCNG